MTAGGKEEATINIVFVFHGTSMGYGLGKPNSIMSKDHDVSSL
jgi:hypothetical protein